jgi:zinc protease
LAAIQAEEEQPEELAQKTFEHALFGSSPYGHPVEGTRESLPRISPEEVRRFYRTYYRPTIATLAVVGDITLEAVKAQLIPRLTQWPAGGAVPSERFQSALAQGPNTETIERKSAQATIILGHGGISRDNPDYYAVAVMNYILGGGGFGSWLMDEIRVKRGLAYSVESFFEARKYPGAFEIVCQTENASTREGIGLALGQMERMKTEMVSQQELERAKKYLIGSFPFRLDTQDELADFLNLAEFFGLGLDYPERYPALIRSVTREEVLRAAKTYLHPGQYILVVVGNLKDAGMEQPEAKQ